MPWGHVTVLLDKLDGQRERDWYAAAAVEYGWSRNVLLNQIMSQLQPRAGTAPSNFTAQLPAADSELAQQLTRDPYVLDFLDLTGPVAERDLEKALVDRLHDFLLPRPGHGEDPDQRADHDAGRQVGRPGVDRGLPVVRRLGRGHLGRQPAGEGLLVGTGRRSEAQRGADLRPIRPD